MHRETISVMGMGTFSAAGSVASGLNHVLH